MNQSLDRVSVVVPCRDEAASIECLLDALRTQDRSIEEVIVVDDGSTDDTRKVIERYRARFPGMAVRVIPGPCNGIAAAVNAGVGAATGDVVVRLDAHSCPAGDYVGRCVAAVQAADVGVAGGVWEIEPGAGTVTARAIAHAVSHPMGAGDAAYRVGRTLPAPRDVDTVPFGCFRKSLWTALGGFDERLLTNEDYEFNYRVRLGGHRVVIDPQIRSKYFARTTLSALAAQYLRYGWWKAQMLRRNPGSLRWRQALPAFFVSLCLLLGLGSIIAPAARLAFGLLFAAYLAALLVASIGICGARRAWAICPLLPAAFATVHFGWGLGFLVNILTLGKWPAATSWTEAAANDRRQAVGGKRGKRGTGSAGRQRTRPSEPEEQKKVGV